MYSTKVLAISFEQAIDMIDNHPLLKEKSYDRQAEHHLIEKLGALPDPKIKMSAKNYPIESMRFDETPMTGVEISLSQILPLSKKYSYYEQSASYQEKSKSWQETASKRSLYKSFWEHLIETERLQRILKITENNIQWIDKMIEISENLYANGKISQQAIFDLQIRKSELQSTLSSTKLGKRLEDTKLSYLLGGSRTYQSIESIPWHLIGINRINSQILDPHQKALEEDLLSTDLKSKAKAAEKIPDIELAIGYTKRSQKDGLGDFLSLSAQVSLPVTDRTFADSRSHIAKKYAAEQKLKHYEVKKTNSLEQMKVHNQIITEELKILESKSIVFAKGALEAITNAYRLGTASYVELLNFELKLQNLELKLVELEARKKLNSLDYNVMLGGALHE